ncbi:hypothetical protein G6011_02919 [Alternaria panax]|uniref:Zn(2)-C6 fungal-type domain-containing protein n=1 Tax=Alternaria panax TaxID=48097 RepID=A0AAD4FCN9_9PLEO|nr:hypothetical protein G6011_02919 [Alternaria panax]
MSYRGRPSKGCEACRARKVKCDESRPACSRCSKAGHTCKYRDQADILFRNQTASAAQRAEESWRKRSKSNQRAVVAESSNAYIKTPPSDESTPPHLDDQRSSSGSVHSPGGSVDDPSQDASGVTPPIIDLSRLTITPMPNPSFRRKAFERFVYDFVLPDQPSRPADQPDEALWTFIPLLYQGAPEDSLIATAVDAVSYVNYANRCNDPQAQALSEECNLTSVQRKGTFIAHNHGANALLQLRTVEQFYSDPLSARLYEVIYAHLLLGNLQTAKRPAIPTKDVIKVDELLPSLYKSSNAFVIRLIWREAMLHARWHEVKQSANPPTNRAALQELLQAALELNDDFQAWEANITPAWNYHTTPNTPEARSTYHTKWQKLFLCCRGAPEEIHSYPSVKRAWIWGFYRTSHVLVLRDLLEMLNWILRFRDPGRSAAAQGQAIPTVLSDKTLRMHHSVATARLVEVIERNCSAIIGSFTVPIHMKSNDDVVGMRGYIDIWPLGTMDAVLCSGLVPDSNSSNTSRDASQMPTPPSTYSHHPNTPPHLHTATSSGSASSEPSENLESYASAPQFSDLNTIRSRSGLSSSPSPPANVPAFDPNAKKDHIFDPHPAHPYDRPLDLPPLDFETVVPRRIDVAARREWINRLLYYFATELGLKKALWVPVMQGFMPTVKPMVDDILSQERHF